jgi:hypothetical protein
MKEYGVDRGYAWFFKLLELLAENVSNDYKLDLNKKFVFNYVTNELQIEINDYDLFKSFVKDCTEMELFIEDDDVFIYSNRLRNHLLAIDDDREAKSLGQKKRWAEKKQQQEVNTMVEAGSSTAKAEARFLQSENIITSGSPKKKSYSKPPNYYQDDVVPPIIPERRFRTDIGTDLDIWENENNKLFERDKHDKLIFNTRDDKYDRMLLKLTLKEKGLAFAMQQNKFKHGSEEQIKWEAENEAIRQELKAIEDRSRKRIFSDDEVKAEKLKQYHLIRELIDSLEVESSVEKIKNPMDKDAAKRLYKMVSYEYPLSLQEGNLYDIADEVRRGSKDYSFRIKNLYNQMLVFMNDLRKEYGDSRPGLITMCKELKPIM